MHYSLSLMAKMMLTVVWHTFVHAWKQCVHNDDPGRIFQDFDIHYFPQTVC